MALSEHISLLAPAGSMASLHSAIQAGADAVYFGVAQLNMRARSSDNFVLNDLEEVASVCKKNKVHSALTLNTILYDHDIKLMQVLIDRAVAAGIDSIIAADTSAILYAHSVGLSVHISTQLSVSNIESVKFWAQYADVIVLARELDLRMIKKIVDAIHLQDIRGPSGNLVQIEVFAHGAMCVAVSGRCGMSLFTDNASANRGACKQNCRRAYTVTDKETGEQLVIDNEFVMSPSDMATFHFIDQLLDTGISVLKLEGRGRSPDYVNTVVGVYREAIDAVKAGMDIHTRINDWKARSATVFNRGFSDGYYLGKKQGDWAASEGSKATEQKRYAGIIKKYYPKARVAQMLVQASAVNERDKIVIIGDKTGVVRATMPSMQTENDEIIQVAVQKQLVTFKLEHKVRPNDRLYVIEARR